MTKLRLFAALAAAACLVSLMQAQQPEAPKPGPEHELFKQSAGTWDCTIKAGPTPSKGTSVSKLALGGLALVTDFTGDMGGLKFYGHGIDTYDPVKKKHVSVWTDSMDPAPMVSEGTYDKATKTLNMVGKGRGPDGQPAEYVMKTVYTSKDAMTFTLSTRDKDGKDQLMMTIEYKRAK